MFPAPAGMNRATCHSRASRTYVPRARGDEPRYHKKTTLTQLDVGHEQLRMLLYLAYELGYFAHHKGKSAPPNVGERRWMVISNAVDEIGRMIGGWIKKEQALTKQ